MAATASLITTPALGMAVDFNQGESAGSGRDCLVHCSSDRGAGPSSSEPRPILAPYLIGWQTRSRAQETPSGGEGMQIFPQPTGRQNRPVGRVACETEGVESAISG